MKLPNALTAGPISILTGALGLLLDPKVKGISLGGF